MASDDEGGASIQVANAASARHSRPYLTWKRFRSLQPAGGLREPDRQHRGTDPVARSGQGAAQLRQEHQLAASLETTLQQEYNFFVSTAHDPKQSASLMQAAATVSSRVSAVVSYDLQAVEARLANRLPSSRRLETTRSPPARLWRRRGARRR